MQPPVRILSPQKEEYYVINHIVVVGSGLMGRGIAYVGAVGGFNVTVVDIHETALENARQEIERMFKK
ncbi:hypothetical protein JQK62_26130, partial [Leptospira santarosai]|nr:hypothetical protein [Leptospira santarosai]